MIVGICLTGIFKIVGFSMLFNTSQAAEPSPTIFTNANQQTRVEYWTFDPLVISTSGGQSVSLSVQTSGSPSSVKLVLARGSERMLDDMGNGRYTTTITHAEATCCSLHMVHRSFVGRLDLDDGEMYKLVINVDDGTIPDVTVMDLDENTRISPRIVNFLIPRGDPTQLNMDEVTRLFYQYFPDEFDFINIVTTPAQFWDTYFINVKNSVQGLGLDLFDRTSTYGSLGRLEGIVHIPTPEHLDLAGLEYLRMLGYNWMNYSKHSKLSGATPHWPISSLASGIMGYQDKWSNEHHNFPYYFDKQGVVVFPYRYWTGDYVLKPLYSTPRYSSMELYLMGLLPASQVYDGHVVPENQYQEVCSYCVIKGPFFQYSVNNLKWLHGSRVPDHSESRRNFKAATIVVSNDRLLSPQEIRHFDRMAARGESIGELPYSFDNVIRSTNPFRTATRDNRYGYESVENASLDAVITKELEHSINEGLNDAWYDPDMPGQGFFVNVLPESKRMFIGWFTYSISQPNLTGAQLGGAYNRWVTALGEYSGNRAELVLYKTIGGVFNSDTPTENSEIGKLVFKLNGCGHPDIEYDIHVFDLQGQPSVQRIAGDNVSWCEELQQNPTDMLFEESPKISGRAKTVTHAPSRIVKTEESLAALEAESFRITEGLNGAWFNPDWPGQGFFIDVLPNIQQVFLGWFTFNTERVYESFSDRYLGDLNQRWFTALGGYEGNQAKLELTLTRGGKFLSKQPAATNEEYGTLDLSFSDCETAMVHYEIPTLELEGVIPLKRISDENTKLCNGLLNFLPPGSPGDGKNTISVVDLSTNNVGRYSSVAIGNDGYPVISYHDETVGALVVAKCNDVACAGGDETITTVINPPNSDMGEYSSIAIGNDAFPVISFFDRITGSLMVAKCNDASCDAFEKQYSQVDDNEGNVGHSSSLVIGTDGYPVIAYRVFSTGALRVAKCNDPACAGGNESISTLDDPDIRAEYISLVLGTDGYPVISYHDFTTRSLKVAKCNDVACVGGDESINTVDDPTNEVGAFSSIAIGEDGFPVISYYDSTTEALKVAKCNDAACAGGDETITTVEDQQNAVGISTSIAVGTDGMPIISYTDNTVQSLKVAKCNDAACTGGDEAISTLEDADNRLISGSIVIGADGLPVITYQDVTAGTLKVVHCGAKDCIP